MLPRAPQLVNAITTATVITAIIVRITIVIIGILIHFSLVIVHHHRELVVEGEKAKLRVRRLIEGSRANARTILIGRHLLSI
jgi:hypothetical protein